MTQQQRDQLIVKNTGLVYKVASKYGKTYEQTEDYSSVGMIGLVKAVDSFKPNGGQKLSTYAWVCIENEIRMYLRYNKKRSGFLTVSIDDEIADTGYTIGDLILDKTDVEADAIASCVKSELGRYLSGQQYMAMQMQLDGKRQIEIARLMRVSRAQISRALSKAQRKLRAVYGD